MEDRRRALRPAAASVRCQRRWALAFAALAGWIALPGRAAPILPAPTTLAHCAVDSNTLDDPTACTLGTLGSSLASLTLLPFVSLTAQAASPPNDAQGTHGSAAAAVVSYSFEVTGGNPGDIVPILIAASLTSSGSDPTHGIGQAILSVHTSAAGDSFVTVCSDGTCGTAASTFSGTLATRARSGDAGNTLSLQVQASTGDSASAESASASADPFLFVDPSFPGASLYDIEVSPGVGNVAVPEPASATLVVLGILVCARSRGHAARSALPSLSGDPT